MSVLEKVDETEPLLSLKTAGVLSARNKKSRMDDMDLPEPIGPQVFFKDRVFGLIKLSIPITIAGTWAFAFNFIIPKSLWVNLIHAILLTLAVLAALYFITSHPSHDDFDTTIGKFYKLGGMTFGMMVSWAWTGFLASCSQKFISSEAHHLVKHLSVDHFAQNVGFRFLFAACVIAVMLLVTWQSSKHIIMGKKNFKLVMWVLLETAMICPTAWAFNDAFRYIALHQPGHLQATLWLKCIINLVACPVLLKIMSMDFSCSQKEKDKAKQSITNQRMHAYRQVMGAMVAWAILDACDATLSYAHSHYSLGAYVGFNFAHCALFTLLSISFAYLSGFLTMTDEEGLLVYTVETVTMTLGMSFGWSYRDLNKNILGHTLTKTMYGGYAQLIPVAVALAVTGLGVGLLLLLVPNTSDEWGSSSSFSDDDDETEEGVPVKSADGLRPHHRVHYHHRQTLVRQFSRASLGSDHGSDTGTPRLSRSQSVLSSQADAGVV